MMLLPHMFHVRIAWDIWSSISYMDLHHASVPSKQCGKIKPSEATTTTSKIGGLPFDQLNNINDEHPGLCAENCSTHWKQDWLATCTKHRTRDKVHPMKNCTRKESSDLSYSKSQQPLAAKLLLSLSSCHRQPETSGEKSGRCTSSNHSVSNSLICDSLRTPSFTSCFKICTWWGIPNFSAIKDLTSNAVVELSISKVKSSFWFVGGA